ncbi:RNA polymerase sigma-70 factor (ECF subfamily) [Kineosporia succinea]|uniref:RNA polymerase sigma factor n=1 Tax=Kineosporia succinea TaxID=84632 RepID=A0ABT9PDF2_9ACTN|nr:RNA polymerase sigma factor [Kineosporia succinea]MDP9830738.1 RNA polymerase sigma-70 factor (ECF subfamily) [Kineosporia succinea]
MLELVRAAQLGDMGAFALLTEQHRASLRATAIAMLGYTDEVDDVVQDALLTALRTLPSLRDPAAAGAWLKAIVRNNCRAVLRSRRPLPVAEPEPLMPSFDPGAELDRALDAALTRDWVRAAVASLSAPVREVTLLRYFSGVSSYRQIGQLCGIPAATVGSRLREGRRTLAARLRATAGQVQTPPDPWHAQSQQLFGSMADGSFARTVDDWYRPDASVLVMGILRSDTSILKDMLAWTLGAGVGVRMHDSASSRDVVLWEADFINPPSDPEHCPPTMACLFRLDGGRVATMGITYGSQPRTPAGVPSPA